MGVTLTGKTIASTYTYLLKVSGNSNIGSSIKKISDGDGNEANLYLSTTQTLVGAGSVSVPSLAIYGSTTTGLYSPNANQLGISIAGSQKALFYSGGLTLTGDISVSGGFKDSNNTFGTSGQVLASTGSGTDWVNLSEISGIDGSGTLNTIPKFTPDGNTIGDSTITDDGTNVTIAANVKLGDAKEIQLGASTDLKLFHNGTDSLIVNETGNLYLRNKANDKDIVFDSDDGSGGVSTYFFLDGSSAQRDSNNNLIHLYTVFPDKSVAGFGDDIDLKIYRGSSKSYIEAIRDDLSIESIQGKLSLISPFDDTEIYSKYSGGGYAHYLVADASDYKIKLFFDGSQKLETNNDGIEVTGDVEADEFIGDLRGAVLFIAQAGEALTKGDVVYISGISGTTTVVSKADNDAAGKMPAFGLVNADASLNASCEVVTFGTLSGIDTSSYSEGDELYVSQFPAGLQNTKPAGESRQVQKIAKVTRSHATAGSVKVIGAGRVNDTPNLDNGNIFIGNSSNEVTTVSLSSEIETAGDNRYLQLTGGTLTGGLLLQDNVILDLGTDNDLRIHHTGSAGVISNRTGNLTIQNGANDSDIIFKSDDGDGGLATYFALDGGITRTVAYKNFNFQDNVKLEMGTGADLQMYHDGSNSFIKDTGTGSLVVAGNQINITNAADTEYIAKFIENSAVELYHNGSKRFETTAGGAIITGTLDTSGTIVSTDGNIRVGSDTGKFLAGASNDLQMYHDGSHSYIQDAGTGELRLSANVFRVLNANSSETMIYAEQDGKVQLRFNESTKFETTNTGISVTGDVIASGDVRVPDGEFLSAGNSNDLTITNTGVHALITNYTGNLTLQNLADDSDIIFKSDDGSGGSAEYFRVDGGIVRTVFSKDTKHEDSVKAFFGSGYDLEIFHGGVDSYLVNQTGNLQFIQKADDKDIQFFSDDGSGGFTEYFRVDGSGVLTFFSKPIQIADNQKIFAGDAGDLQIYHNGTHSYIDDAGTGKLILRGNTDVEIHKYTGEYMITATADGAVSLYFDDSKKLETTNVGITVSGTTASSSLLINGGADAQAKILGTTTAARLDIQTDSHHRFLQTIESDGRFRLYNQTTSAEQLTVLSDGKTGINTSSPSRTLDIRGDAQILSTGATGLRIVGGTSNEVYMIFGDADDNSMGGFGYDNNTNTLTIDVNNAERINIASDGTIKFNSYGAGYLKTDANGVISVDTSTIEDTLDSVTDRGATTTNAISVGGITSSGASSGRYTGLEVVNTTNAGGTETAIGLGVVSAANTACDVKLVANRVAANSGSDFYIEQTNSSGTQVETFRITEDSNATFAGNVNISKDGYQLRLKRADGADDDWRFYSWASGLNIYPQTASTIFFGRDGQTADVNVWNGDFTVTSGDSNFAGTITTTSTATGAITLNGGTGVATTGAFILRQNGDGAGNGIAITSSHATSHRIWKDASGNLNIGPSSDADAFIQDLSGNITIAGNLQADYQLLGRAFRGANRGELHLNGTGTDDVAEIFFGHGSGYTENNIRWAISDRGTTDGNLKFYRGPANGGFQEQLTLHKNGLATFQGGVKVDNGDLILGEDAFSVSADYVGMKTSHQSGTNDYMIISGTSDGSTYVSSKSGSATYIRAGGNHNTHQLAVSSSQARFYGDLQVDGNLTVSGTTTTIDTTNLDVKDKNITLNYGSGDTSANADGAGITIQDAVDADNNATILWDQSDSEFDFSHGAFFGGNVEIESSLPILRLRFNANYYTDYNTNGIDATGTNQTFAIRQNGSGSLLFDATQNASFVGDVDVADTLKVNQSYQTSNEYVLIGKNTANDGGIVMSSKSGSNSATNDWQIVNSGGTRDLHFYAYGLGGNALTLDREDGSAIFAGTIQSDDITIADGSNDVSLNLGNASYGLQLDYSAGDIFFRTNGATRLTIANGGAATFAQDVTVNSDNLTLTTAASVPLLSVETSHPSGIPIVNLKGAASAQIRYKDENDTIQSRIDLLDGGAFNFIDTTSSTTHLSIDSSGDSTFAGNIKILNSKSGFILADRHSKTSFELPYFTHNTSDLAVDIYLGNDYINGILELRLTSGYSYQNAVGEAYFKWIVGLNPNGSIWYTPKLIESNVTDQQASQIYVDNPAWDSTNSRYFIRVYHKNNQGNQWEGTLTNISQGRSDDLLDNIDIGSLLTSTSTTNTHPTGLYYNGGKAVFTDQIRALDTGSTGSPTYSFDGNTTTGISARGTNNLELITAGSTALFFYADQSAQFLDKVGIGVAPTAKLHVQNNAVSEPLALFQTITAGDASVRIEGIGGESYLEIANTHATTGDTSNSWGIGMDDNTSLSFGWGTNNTLNKSHYLTITNTGNASFAGTISSGALTVGNSGTSRFTDTGAFPLQLNRGLPVDVFGTNGVVLGLGSYSTGTTYVDAARIAANLESATSGDFFIQVNNGGSYTNALSINNDTNASFAGNVDLKSDSGNATKFLRIHNQGTATNDDAVLTWQTQASRHFSMGIHRDSGLLTISNLDASVSSGELMTMDLNGVTTFAGNVTLSASDLHLSSNTGEVIWGAADDYNSSIGYVDNGGGDHYLALRTRHAGTTQDTLKIHANTKLSTFTGNVAISGTSGDTLTLTKTTTEPSLRIEGDTNKDFVITVSGEHLTFTQNDGATDILILDHDTKNATFASKVRANSWFLGADGTNTLWSNVTAGTLIQTAGSTANNNDSKIYFRNSATTVKHTFDTNNGSATFTGNLRVPTLSYGDPSDDSPLGALSYGSDFVTLETNGAFAIQLKTNGTTALTLDTSQGATFASNIFSDYNKTIALNYAAGTFGDYYKGMSGVDFGSGTARGLHLFNFDNDTNLGINFWVGTYASKTFAGRIDSAGKWGIGTDAPDDALLHIYDTVNRGGTGNLRLTNTSNTQTVLLLENTTSRKYELAVGGSANSVGNGSFYIYDVNAAASRFEIDSSGNVGIGVIDQPDEKLHIQGSANGNVKALIENTNTGTNAYATLGFQSDQNHTVQPALFLNGANNTNYAGANSLNMYQFGNFSLGFVTNNLLRMSVTGDGKVNVGNITGTFKFNVAGGIYASGASQIASDGYDVLKVSGAGSTSGPTMEIKTSGTTSGASSLDIYQVNTIYGPSAIQFFYGSTSSTAVGSIRALSSSTQYNTSSDYRLKENITNLSNALERVDNLEPKRFNFKNTPDVVVDGFLAHEAQEVVPQAVSGEKDAEIDGKPSYQGIDHSMIVPLLTAAIKELKAQNEELLARIEKLENN